MINPPKEPEAAAGLKDDPIICEREYNFRLRPRLLFGIASVVKLDRPNKEVWVLFPRAGTTEVLLEMVKSKEMYTVAFWSEDGAYLDEFLGCEHLEFGLIAREGETAETASLWLLKTRYSDSAFEQGVAPVQPEALAEAEVEDNDQEEEEEEEEEEEDDVETPTSPAAIAAELRFLRFMERLSLPSREPSFFCLPNYKNPYGTKHAGTPTNRFYRAFLPLLLEGDTFFFMQIMALPSCSSIELYQLFFESLLRSKILQTKWLHDTHQWIERLVDQPSAALATYRKEFRDIVALFEAKTLPPLYWLITQAEYLKPQTINELRDLHERYGLIFLLVSDHDGFRNLLDKTEGSLRFIDLASEALDYTGASTSYLENLYLSFEDRLPSVHNMETLLDSIQTLSEALALAKENLPPFVPIVYERYGED